jgi:transcriptional regulator with XRE-family HTH domain
MELDHTSSRGTGLEGKEILEGQIRSKSPHKILYAAEIKIFRAQHGGLEDIRQKLGYSRRKMCRLLMVDPSAWTRWTKDEDRVPPHVYRALEWFLALNERIYTQPELGEMFMQRYRVQPKVQENVHSSSSVVPISTRTVPLQSESETARTRELEEQMIDLQKRLEEQKRMVGGLIAAGLAIGACILTYFLLKMGV